MAGAIGTLLTYEKPKIPEYGLVDMAGEQNASISQNIASLPGLRQLTSGVNRIASAELLKQLERMLPGYSDLLKQGTELIQSQFRGEIPEDVVREVSRTSAERSRAGGFGGSEFSDNLTARDLGLTSLSITQQALNNAQRWMAQATAATPRFDFTQMFVTPQQRIQTKLYENAQVYQRNLVKSQVDAMPEKWEAAVAAYFDNLDSLAGSVLSAYAGGAMGGGAGGGSSTGGTSMVNYGG